MQPHQRASQSIRSGEESSLGFLKNIGLTAAGGGAAGIGSKVAGKLVPAIGALISNYIPENLSIAGLTKVDPRFGKFIKGAMDQGFGYDDIRNFIGEKIDKFQSSQKEQEKKNVIEQYSPDLFKFMEQRIKEGHSPINVGSLALKDPKFSKAIKQMEKDYKSSWSNILQTVFGSPEEPQGGVAEQEAQRYQQHYGNQP